MANFYTDNENLRLQLDHPLMERIVKMKEEDYSFAKTEPIAPLNFEDAMDTYDKVLEVVGDICGEVIGPNAESVDQEGARVENGRVVYAKGTQENLKALTDAKLFGMSLPYKYGGLNLSMVPYVMSAELVSRADGGFANIWGLQDCAETIKEFASEEIKDEFLPRINQGATCSMDLTEPDAGSDLQAVQLKATWDEPNQVWRLNGVKRFITNGDADIKLVLARSEEGTKDGRGLSYFVYDKVDQGVTVRRVENKMGIKGSPTCELVFKNAPAKLVGSRRLGLIKYVMSLMNGARLGVGAQSVGISEAAYREAYKYATEREQFGKAIIHFPAVYELIQNMKAKIDASRSILYETARAVDMYKLIEEIGKTRTLTPEERAEMKHYTRIADALTPMLKLFSSEYCNQVCYDAIQVHGGTGFMKDFPVERMYRDARITSIYEGTSQLQVVAAIAAVIKNTYSDMIADYAAQPVTPEFESLKADLVRMAEEYEEARKIVTDMESNEALDFLARRLVEMAGHVVMTYILMLDAIRAGEKAPDLKRSAFTYHKMVRATHQAHFSYIKDFKVEDLDEYRQI
ncbi:MAG TPA: acyl-CoA dehydrogenase family protein [Bacteroidales bacterium]|nr:acyl-CoA dehydrogenase family protein [Bacteroidales bacterium]HOH22975.1 acyl-CoA dehydrogenase family protein [Bacteroidales bacterium]HPZ03638.1 acyl-CoA dehydrogenase family protein [Bacteroidales bacterium]HQB75239.1 acyl-CoA dehydrogenase family protein [Bacteroidales bacterium]